MKEEESIQDFHMNILDMDKSFDALGEKMSEDKLVRKILRSLPKRFDMKVTAIEEAQDISTMKVDELIGSLQNHEIIINNRVEKKNKNLAFASNTEESQLGLEEDEELYDSVVLLGRQFNRVLRQVGRRTRPNGQNIRLTSTSSRMSLRNLKKRISNLREYSVMNVKDMVMLDQNVLPT